MIVLAFAQFNSFTNSSVAVQRAQANLQEAEELEKQTDEIFIMIDNNFGNKNENRKVKRYVNDIFLNSTKAQKNIKEAIYSIGEAKGSTSDYQLKTYYDMKINALNLKKDINKNSYSFASKIKENINDPAKTERIINHYYKVHDEQEEMYEILISKAENFMSLKKV